MVGFDVVKDPAYRSKKYAGSMDPDVIRDRFASQRGAMTEQQRAYFGEISLVEAKAKKIVEEAGVPTIEVAQYINVARKCYSLSKKFSGATLTLEAQALVNHWASRGLNGLLLAKVCNISGCGCAAGVPSGTPLACSPGDLLVCGLDGWEAFSPGDSCKVLHSQGPGVLPNWVDHGGIGGLLDDDHTQYVLRSILTTHGDLFFRNGAGIQRLGPGTSGKFLKTQGPGANPMWDDAPGGAEFCFKFKPLLNGHQDNPSLNTWYKLIDLTGGLMLRKCRVYQLGDDYTSCEIQVRWVIDGQTYELPAESLGEDYANWLWLDLYEGVEVDHVPPGKLFMASEETFMMKKVLIQHDTTYKPISYPVYAHDFEGWMRINADPGANSIIQLLLEYMTHEEVT